MKSEDEIQDEAWMNTGRWMMKLIVIYVLILMIGLLFFRAGDGEGSFFQRDYTVVAIHIGLWIGVMFVVYARIEHGAICIEGRADAERERIEAGSDAYKENMIKRIQDLADKHRRENGPADGA